MMQKNYIKIILVVAMILPFSAMNFAAAEQVSITIVEKMEEPTEFVGTLRSDTKQIGNFLYVKHIYTSDGLEHHNVDHVYREEIIPVNQQMTQQGLAELTGVPKVTESHKMSLVHEDEVSKIDRIQKDNDVISSETFQQWKIVGISDKEDSTGIKRVIFNEPPIKHITHVEDWASKKNGTVYTSYDPINLIWTDTKSTGGDLLSKVDKRISSQGWTDLCHSTDLYINIDGAWTKQNEHFIDYIDGLCNQFHVRAWEINDNLVIGSAHKEISIYKMPWEKVDIEHLSATGPSGWEYDINTFGGFYHALTGFDSSEDETAGEFSGSCWSTSKDSHYMNNVYTRNYYKDNVLENSAYNDGYATTILCS